MCSQRKEKELGNILKFRFIEFLRIPQRSTMSCGSQSPGCKISSLTTLPEREVNLFI